MKISLDTNILIDEPQIVFDKTREFVLSFTVIRELDKLKRNIDLKRSAQQAIKNIWVKFQKDEIEILNVPNLLSESPDEKIIQDTKDANASILSNDIAVRIIAHAHGIPISDFEAEDEIDYDYTGYQEIEATPEYNKTFHALKDMQLEEFEHNMSVKLKINEYCIINTTSEKYDIWKNINGTVYRISQKMGPYTSSGIKGVQPLDAVQMCALDAIFDPVVPLTVIDGKLGTGKSLLSIMAALATTRGEKRYKFYEKILVTKPPVSINRDMYTGFKPGSSEEKMSGHLGGIKTNLKYLLDSKTTKKLKPGEEEALSESDKAWNESIGIIEIDEIQGASLHNTIFLVDEYQLMDTDTLKLVISRISENSKLVLIGDTAGQTYGQNRANEGFKTLYKHLGTAPEFNFIKMENIYRSNLAAFVSHIFDD